MKIIANLICLNSAPELPTLLETLVGRIDGVVAIDGGSTDDTVEILSAWGVQNDVPVKTHVCLWPDDFAEQRNRCLNLTRVVYSDEDVWVLMIDTDDRLTAFDRAFLEKACENPELHGVICTMDNGNGLFRACQFFRLTTSVQWRGAVHEHISFQGHRGLPPDGTLTITRGYSAQHERDVDRNVRIGRRTVEKLPTDSRARFYLARDLLEGAVPVDQQRRAEAEGHLRLYRAMNVQFPEQNRYALLLLVRILCDTGRRDEAILLLNESIANDRDNRSAYEALAALLPSIHSDALLRLASAAKGDCILPYQSLLPKTVRM